MHAYNLCMVESERKTKSPTIARHNVFYRYEAQPQEIAAGNKETMALSDNQLLSFMSVFRFACWLECAWNSGKARATFSASETKKKQNKSANHRIWLNEEDRLRAKQPREKRKADERIHSQANKTKKR